MDEAKRKAIEMTVNHMRGEWPEGHRHIGGLVMDSGDNGDYTYKCTRDEFEQVKAEMQNKPSWSDAPEWAEWLAQDECGEWWFYRGKPSYDDEGFYENSFVEHCLEGKGAVIADWRNTLEKRPNKLARVFTEDDFKGLSIEDKPMKYEYGVEYECSGVKPEGLPDDVLVDAYGLYSKDWHNKEKPVSDWPWANFEKFRIVDERYKPNLDDLSAKEPTPELRELMRGDWHERGEKPPVGETVEYHENGDKWVECTVLGTDDDAVWIRSSCWRLVTRLDHIRPIRTERDELVDHAIMVMTDNSINNASNVDGLTLESAKRLVDKGWRPPKN